MRACVCTHSDLTPHTVQPGQALVTLDAAVTAVTLSGRVPLHPHVLHRLQAGRERAGGKLI